MGDIRHKADNAGSGYPEPCWLMALCAGQEAARRAHREAVAQEAARRLGELVLAIEQGTISRTGKPLAVDGRGSSLNPHVCHEFLGGAVKVRAYVGNPRGPLIEWGHFESGRYARDLVIGLSGPSGSDWDEVSGIIFAGGEVTSPYVESLQREASFVTARIDASRVAGLVAALISLD